LKSRLDRVEALRTEDEAKKSTEEKRKEKNRTEENRREQKRKEKQDSTAVIINASRDAYLAFKGAAPWREGGTDNRVEITP
jgi:hypothetical protein